MQAASQGGDACKQSTDGTNGSAIAMEADTGAAEEPWSPQGSMPARPRSQLSPLARLYPDRLEKARQRSLQASGLNPSYDLISNTASLFCCTSLSWQLGIQWTGQSDVGAVAELCPEYLDRSTIDSFLFAAAASQSQPPLPQPASEPVSNRLLLAQLEGLEPDLPLYSSISGAPSASQEPAVPTSSLLAAQLAGYDDAYQPYASRSSVDLMQPTAERSAAAGELLTWEGTAGHTEPERSSRTPQKLSLRERMAMRK